MAKILICDDSWLTRRGVKRMVQAEGHEVYEADNGLQGLEFIRQSDKAIDVVILDLLMPEMSGVEFLEALREEQMTVPVIVLTADIQPEAEKIVKALGALGYMEKTRPLNINPLIEILKNLGVL